jgi:hypothetical protein
MDALRITVDIANPFDERRARRTLASVLVDPDEMFSVLPASLLEEISIRRRLQVTVPRRDGAESTRWMGDVMLYAGGRVTVDHVLFSEGQDTVFIGSHALAGLNLKVDPATGLLVDGGPIVAAAVAA